MDLFLRPRTSKSVIVETERHLLKKLQKVIEASGRTSWVATFLATTMMLHVKERDAWRLLYRVHHHVLHRRFYDSLHFFVSHQCCNATTPHYVPSPKYPEHNHGLLERCSATSTHFEVAKLLLPPMCEGSRKVETGV